MFGHAADPLLAGGKRGRGKRKRKGKGKVLVCLSGETQQVSPSAVRGVLLAGGTRGACASGGQTPPPRDETPPPGAGEPPVNVQMIIENLTAGDVDFEGWIATVGSSRECRVVELRTIAPNNAVTFDPRSPWLYAIVYFDPNDHVEPYLFQVLQGLGDPFPDVRLAQGGQMTRETCDNGFSTAEERDMGVGQKFTRTVKGHQIEVGRENDINGERLIRVRLLS
jgi:hypothetical protein